MPTTAVESNCAPGRALSKTYIALDARQLPDTAKDEAEGIDRAVAEALERFQEPDME
jgi:hypothetical protein